MKFMKASRHARESELPRAHRGHTLGSRLTEMSGEMKIVSHYLLRSRLTIRYAPLYGRAVPREGPGARRHVLDGPVFREKIDPGLQVLFRQYLRDLHCIQGRTFPDVIGHDPHVETMGNRFVPSYPSHKGVVPARRVDR